jgi:hypothetical protein
MDQLDLVTMEGGMRTWHFLVGIIFVLLIVLFGFPDVVDSTREGIFGGNTSNEEQTEHPAGDQSVPPWEREGHEPVTPASSPPQTQPTSPQTAPVAEQPELASASAPVSEGGVDPWGRHYDALVEVTTPPEVHTCGFVLVTRGFSRRTPQQVHQSFTNAIITRVCSVPRDQRVFPQGETCEATPNWHEGALYQREACYTFTPWGNRTP